MSDRARGSVRTESRGGSGTADEAPAGAAPVSERTESAGGSTDAPGAPASGAEPAGTSPEAGRTPARSGASSTSAAEQPGKASAPAQAPAAAAQAGKAPAAQQATTSTSPGWSPKAATTSPADGPATGSGAASAPAQAAPTAEPGPRPVTTPAPPVPPATGTNRAVGASRPAAPRSGVPAAGSVPVDSTQAVPLPPAGARPVDPARPAAARQVAEGTGRENTGRVRGAGRGPRRARLQLRHIDTWSALKISLVLSIALFFVWMVAVGILYGVLSGLGVFDSVNDLIGQVSSSTGTDVTADGDVINAGVVFGGAAVIGAVNIVLLTALCTVATFVYNLCSDLVGGLEVTLAERD